MKDIEQKFSSELQNLFSYVVDVLNLEYPTKKIGIDYMIVAMLDNKKTHAYALLNSCLMSSNMNELRNIYGDKLKNNSSPQFYKNNENEIIFDKEMENIIQAAQKEYVEMNSPYVGSEHLILALLKEQEIIDICDVEKVNYWPANYGLKIVLFTSKGSEYFTYLLTNIKEVKKHLLYL